MKLKDKGFYWTARVMIVVIILGNAFFFTSGFLIPNTTPTKAATELGAEQKWNDRKITVNRTDYCAAAATIEVEFTVENTAFDGKNNYVFYAQTIPQKAVQIETIIADDSFFVVQIKNLPAKFVEVSLRVILADENGAATNEYIKLYANISSVNKVPEIKVKTKNEYQTARYELLIKQKQDDIEAYNAKISEARAVIENIKADTAKREADRPWQTAEEQNITDQTIKANESKIKAQNEEIARLEAEIDKAKEAIDKANERIKAVEKLIEKEKQ